MTGHVSLRFHRCAVFHMDSVWMDSVAVERLP